MIDRITDAIVYAAAAAYAAWILAQVTGGSGIG